MAKTPYLANYVVRFLSSLFTWAERHGHRPDGSNPCRHVKPFRVQRRQRFLSEVELARLGEVLTEAERTGESPFVVAAGRLGRGGGPHLEFVGDGLKVGVRRSRHHRTK